MTRTDRRVWSSLALAAALCGCASPAAGGQSQAQAVSGQSQTQAAGEQSRPPAASGQNRAPAAGGQSQPPIASGQRPATAAGGQSQAQAAPPEPVPSALTEAAVDEARLLVRPSNDERVDALLEALERRDLPYTVAPFPGTGAEADPRPEGRNVVVTFGAGTPEVIVGAHIDSEVLAGGGISDAMVDDGAGVVVLLHLADALKDVHLACRVRIVFFDMEEIGLVGSRAFAGSLDPADVAAMINVDVVGYGDTVLYGPQATSPDGSPAHRVQRACARRGMPCVGLPAMPSGDDRSFLRAGISAVSLAVLPAGEVHRLWLFLHGDLPDDLRGRLAPEVLRIIHTERDTADRLEPAAMTRALRVVTDVVLDLAAERP